jgi:hypothetical protein
MPAMRGPQINLQARASSQLRIHVSLVSARYGTEVATDGNAVIVEAEGR